MKRPQALLFDVFGTCVDWRRGVAAEAGAALSDKGLTAIDPYAFADAWRAEYQPAMQRIRAGERGYIDLDVLHRENLDRVLETFGITHAFADSERDALSHAWEKLPPWPDVVEGLAAMRASAIIAPCSNGSIALMTRLARHASLPWDCILGAGVARAYKPQAEAYLASCRALRLDPAEVMMVAAHNGDLHAARSFGLMTAFVARPTEYGPHQTLDFEADSDWDCVAADFNALAHALFN